ncbi:hypothetical protein H112_08801 [Trichophyton rubrum D6]|uniref:Uncharacterized protein n=5 Tax=Trichophyton TaxID=5550 RepID=A0A178ERV6_TRIRU|nr:uncharacterized protein TERG_01348 [Trichophyton rubrum CBS 118892]EZF09931.1 hypothetical protein H100_08822 [Trichophyton rubrum MR850]EZF36784.1 hypothetical protein H102_08782 [Trichophyton rubrum CBS 100081]EZF47385.1 hypothetical protein H103_08804 [Trichophyton rubrum CBS 288.86]EZF57952.1 hypothetical protein H104_08753 [Trichophyton rubrum CBS 289.86]EZF68600.1 hypothetical protein H105_08807 [Trichophyton soudanense CBS 452.61]EZF79354.1 hypothetical protein H110_08806 [Trichophy
MPATWNDAARAKLLIAVLKTSVGKLDYKAISEFMGPDYNVKSIQYQIWAIKTKTLGDKASVSNPSTPSKGGKKDAKTPTKSPASAKRERAKVDDAESDSVPDSATPKKNGRSKKVKTEIKQEVKQEIKSEDV